MLFMIIEHFKERDAARIGARFKQSGRMLPNGVIYHASWIDPVNARCFQIMQANDRASLDEWISHWNDLIDFEIIPVVNSADFWRS